MGQVRLDAQWTGKDDIIRIRTDAGSLDVHYYDLQRVLGMFPRLPEWPEPCITCKGSGEIAWPTDEPRDIVECWTCKGTRVSNRPRVAP